MTRMMSWRISRPFADESQRMPWVYKQRGRRVGKVEGMHSVRLVEINGLKHSGHSANDYRSKTQK